jgi:hypothetical protein
MAGIMTKAPPIPNSDPKTPAATPVVFIHLLWWIRLGRGRDQNQSRFDRLNIHIHIINAPITPALTARAPSTPPPPLLPPLPPPDAGGDTGVVTAGGLLPVLPALPLLGGVVVRPLRLLLPLLLNPLDRTTKPSPAGNSSSRCRANVAIEAGPLPEGGISGRLPGARAAAVTSGSPWWCGRRQPLAAAWSI